MFIENILFYTILKTVLDKSIVCLNKLLLQHKQLVNKQSNLLIPFILAQ